MSIDIHEAIQGTRLVDQKLFIDGRGHTAAVVVLLRHNQRCGDGARGHIDELADLVCCVGRVARGSDKGLSRAVAEVQNLHLHVLYVIAIASVLLVASLENLRDHGRDIILTYR